MVMFWKQGGPHGVVETKLVSFRYLSETRGGGGLHADNVKLATMSSASSMGVFLIISCEFPGLVCMSEPGHESPARMVKIVSYRGVSVRRSTGRPCQFQVVGAGRCAKLDPIVRGNDQVRPILRDGEVDP